MNAPRIGSLFSGYGGLDMAVENVTGASTAWFSDIDAGASKILTHRWPNVPNHGDLTQIEWTAVEPVDIITGGFPCQDLSLAGKRRGMAGTRSGLWSHMATAVATLRPQLVVAENVRGLLSGEANSEVEPCPWCVGDGTALDMRALGAVLADLADIGYDAAWHGLTASSVGAPHGRFRVFVIAWPADSSSDGWNQGWPKPTGQQGRPDVAECGQSTASDADEIRHERNGRARNGRPGLADGNLLAPDSDGWGFQVGQELDSDPAEDSADRDSCREHLDRSSGSEKPASDADAARRSRDRAVSAQPQLTNVAGNLSAPADTLGGRWDGWAPDEIGSTERGVAPAGSGEVNWGQFGPAIRRWEHLMGSPAPSPTNIGTKGGHSLAPQFVEWLMGLPQGHVDDVLGLTRNEKLKALGNGVVPQQAEAALRYLLDATAGVRKLVAA